MADTILYTSGADQNSYLTVEAANSLLLAMSPSFVGDDGYNQLDTTDEALLIEACQDLETHWAWNGQPSDYDQPLQWPRRYVDRPGFRRQPEPGWGAPWSADAWLRFKFDGYGASYLDHTVVPAQVLQAQALLALLSKNGKNLVSDTQGDTQGLQLDAGYKVSYVNSARDASDITKRLAGLGWFVGDENIRLPNGR